MGISAWIAERWTWREPILPETLISQDPGLRARTFGSLFTAGGLLAFMIVLFGDDVEREEAVIVVAAAIATVLGLTCFVGFRSLPSGFFVCLTFMGSALVTSAVWASSQGSEGAWVLFYFWVTLLAAIFFDLRFALLQVALAIAGFVWGTASDSTPFVTNYLIALVAVLTSTSLVIGLLRRRIENLAVTLANEAQTDALTSLPNRRAFDERLRVESERSIRGGQPLSVAICDLDGFKAVNDLLGHQEGDEVLKRAGAAIGGAVRTADAVARLGGEEFGVILPDAHRKEAFRVGERIRIAVREEFASDEVPLTVSSGLATFGEDGDGRSLLRAADIALYQAKKRGKDRTVSYDASAEDVPLISSARRTK
jgi:diguanylate cyclase (GGDEF)-like protein